MAGHRRAAIFLALAVAACVPGSAAGSPDVLRATLPNGLRLVVVRNRLSPVVSTDLVYEVGSRDDPPDLPGLAHAQEHLLFRSSVGLPTAALAAVTTALGGSSSAQTGTRTTEYTFVVPADDLDAVLRIEATRMTGALDLDREWALERGTVDEERGEHDARPVERIRDEMRARAYAGTAYVSDGLGTGASLRAMNGSRLRRFYRTWYAPNNALLVVAGDVDPSAVLARVRARFAAIPPRRLPPHRVVPLPPMHRAMFRRTGVTRSVALAGLRFPGFDEPGAAAGAVLRKALEMDGGLLATLGDELGAGATNLTVDDVDEHGVLTYAELDVPAGRDVARTAVLLVDRLAAYARDGIPAARVDRARDALLRDLDRIGDAPGSEAERWVELVEDDRVASPDDERRRIRAVDTHAVDGVARDVFGRARTFAGIVTAPATSAQRIVTTPPRRTEHPPPIDVERTVLPAWVHAVIAGARPPKAAAQTLRRRLPNGVTVVAARLPSASIAIFGRTDAPAFADPRLRLGVTLLDEITSTKTSQAFLDDDDENVDLPGRVDFGVKTTRTAFAAEVKRLAASWFAPPIDDGAVDAGLHVLLPATSPRPATLADVVAALHAARRPEHTTVLVAGDLDPARALEGASRAFGPWQPVGPVPTATATPSSRAPVTVVRSARSGVTQVFLYQTIPIGETSPDIEAMRLGTEILGGGAIGGDAARLYRRARNDTGLVYGIAAGYEAARDSGRFFVAYTCRSRDERRVAAIVDDEIRRMQREPVPDEELRIARAAHVRHLTLATSSLDATAAGMLDVAARGEAFDARRREAGRILDVDATAIRRAFTAIDRGRFVRSIDDPRAGTASDR